MSSLLFVLRDLPIRRLLGARYHPERHYMRGAGPACAARRAQSLHVG